MTWLRYPHPPGDDRRPAADAPPGGIIVELDQEGDVLVVRVGGELDLASGRVFVERTHQAIESAGVPLPARAVVFDLDRLDFLGCAGVRALRGAAVSLLRTGTPCYLRVAPGSVAATVLRLVGAPPELPGPPPGLLAPLGHGTERTERSASPEFR